MSHSISIKATEMKSEIHLAAACNRLKLELPVKGLHTMFDGQEVQGNAVRLPEWHEPVVVKEDGSVVMDNYGGRWGKEIELDKLVQAYKIEEIEANARMNAYSNITEEQLENGDIKLVLATY